MVENTLILIEQAMQALQVAWQGNDGRDGNPVVKGYEERIKDKEINSRQFASDIANAKAAIYEPIINAMYIDRSKKGKILWKNVVTDLSNLFNSMGGQVRDLGKGVPKIKVLDYLNRAVPYINKVVTLTGEESNVNDKLEDSVRDGLAKLGGGFTDTQINGCLDLARKFKDSGATSNLIYALKTDDASEKSLSDLLSVDMLQGACSLLKFQEYCTRDMGMSDENYEKFRTAISKDVETCKQSTVKALISKYEAKGIKGSFNADKLAAVCGDKAAEERVIAGGGSPVPYRGLGKAYTLVKSIVGMMTNPMQSSEKVAAYMAKRKDPKWDPTPGEKVDANLFDNANAMVLFDSLWSLNKMNQLGAAETQMSTNKASAKTSAEDAKTAAQDADSTFPSNETITAVNASERVEEAVQAVNDAIDNGDEADEVQKLISYALTAASNFIGSAQKAHERHMQAKTTETIKAAEKTKTDIEHLEASFKKCYQCDKQLESISTRTGHNALLVEDIAADEKRGLNSFIERAGYIKGFQDEDVYSQIFNCAKQNMKPEASPPWKATVQDSNSVTGLMDYILSGTLDKELLIFARGDANRVEEIKKTIKEKGVSKELSGMITPFVNSYVRHSFPDEKAKDESVKELVPPPKAAEYSQTLGL